MGCCSGKGTLATNNPPKLYNKPMPRDSANKRRHNKRMLLTMVLRSAPEVARRRMRPHPSHQPPGQHVSFWGVGCNLAVQHGHAAHNRGGRVCQLAHR